MTSFAFGALIFFCGTFVGFIAAAFMSVGARDDEPEFDGGWQASNEPRVRTVIWSRDVEADR